MQKKTKRKLNKKRFFGLLIFLAIGISFICYLLNLKVSNVLIIGNQEILDSTIIKASGLREYPYYKNIKKRMIEKEIGDIPLIDTVKVSKYLNGTIKKIAKKAKIPFWKNMSNHCLRAAFATSKNIQGISLPVIQKAMGHVNLSTTLLYIKSNQAQVNNSMRTMAF